MGYILAFLRLVAVGVTMFAYLAVFVIKDKFRRRSLEEGFRLRRNWATLGSKILGVKNQVSGKPLSKGPALYVCNHRSTIDPMVIAPFVDVIVIAKSDVANYPILGRGSELTGVVWVDRDSKDSRKAVRKAMANVFEKKGNIMVFAEGTVANYKTTKSFKMGSFVVASEMDIPVVPIVLEYRDDKDLWRRDNMMLQYFNQFNHWHTYTKMHFGETILNQNPDFLMRETRNYIDDKLTEIHKNWTRMKFDPMPNEEKLI